MTSPAASNLYHNSLSFGCHDKQQLSQNEVAEKAYQVLVSLGCHAFPEASLQLLGLVVDLLHSLHA